MLRGAIFINPRSGTAAKVDLDELQKLATEERFEIVPIEGAIDIASEIRKRIAKGQKRFVAAGGDGTIHHVIQALVSTDAELAILPIGTVNHMAKDLGVPLDWREAFALAATGDTKEVDVGAVNGVYFVNILMLGLYPDVVREREKVRGSYGKIRSYARAARMTFKRFRHVSVVFETPHRMEALKTHMFAVAVNAYDLESTGIVAPRVAFDQGSLAVYWLPQMDRLQMVRAFARYFRGAMKTGDQLRFLSTPQVTIHSKHQLMRVGMDGELHQLSSPLRVTIVPRSLRIVAPPAPAEGKTQ
jgi:diacylglycerol kinase family enzyme